MLFARLPNPADPAAPRDYPWGRQTVVVHDRAEQAVYGRHTAPLSIKTVAAGAESYNVHGFDETVAPGEYLVVNKGQRYESAIDAETPVETLCVFFSDADARDGFRAGLSEAALLDDPCAAAPRLEFAAVKRRADEGLAKRLAALPRLRDAPALTRQEAGALLLLDMLRLERVHQGRAERLDALRTSTRRELLRRCEIARAYITGALAEDVTLIAVADAAALSQTHLLRAFQRCFDETPAQMLRRLRLERAGELLCGAEMPVSEAALAVGYANFSAFARAFRRHYGVAPTQFVRNSQSRHSI